MNKINNAFGAIRTMVLGDRPKTPTELATSIRKDIASLREHIQHLQAHKVDGLCADFHLKVLSIHDSNQLHNLIDDRTLRQRVQADGGVKSCYADIGNKVRRYCEQEQRRSRHVYHLWAGAEHSITKATLGQLPEQLEQFAQKLEDSDLIN